MKKILYILLFIYSSLFAALPTSGYDESQNQSDILSQCNINSPSITFNVSNVYDYSESGRTARGYIVTDVICYGVQAYNDDGSVKYYSAEYDWLDERTTTYHWYNSKYNIYVCDSGLHYDSSSDSCINDTPSIICSDNEIYDSNTSLCIPFPIPTTFPIDANASHGSLSNGVLSIPESDCNSASTPDMSTSLGAYHVVGWDTTTSTCKAMAFKCNGGLVYDSANKTCIAPPTELSKSNANQDNACSGKFVERLSGTLNFCNQCGFSLGYWRPPLGYEDYNLQCDHSYIEYACSTDYRIKKFVEVSCGDPLPQDMTTKELDLSNLDSNVKDTNVSSVTNTDSSSNQIETINQLKNINSSILATNKSLDGLTNIATDSNAKLGSIESKVGSLDGNVKAIKDGLFTDGTLPDMSTFDTDTSSMLDSVTSAINKFKSDVDNAIFEINSKKALIDKGFFFPYTKERVSTCSITKVFDMGEGGLIPFDVDYCKSLSSFYDVGYLISYISIVGASLSFMYLIIIVGL